MNKYITSAQDLVTPHKETRAAFISFALIKNNMAAPYVASAKSLKVLASAASSPEDLLKIPDIQQALLSASGLSDKALQYFNDDDKKSAIQQLIDKFLKPAGESFVDELVYRYLLVKGDSLGGSFRNVVGAIAKVKLTRKILSVLHALGISYATLSKDQRKTKKWANMNYPVDYQNAESIACITWTNNNGKRVLIFDARIPSIKKNVDICLYKGDATTYDRGAIVRRDDLAIMFGELKGGFDPAGADEHWKTGNSAILRVSEAFTALGHNVSTSFIGAAIEKNMADEIWEKLSDGGLTNAANTTSNEQFTEYCEWVIKI